MMRKRSYTGFIRLSDNFVNESRYAFEGRYKYGDKSYATLGWIINKTYRGQGYASEAASGILDFAFKNLGIDKVYAQCDIQNPASFGVMRKIGMKCVNDKGTRTYPRTGVTSGEYTCLITRKEWEERN